MDEDSQMVVETIDDEMVLNCSLGLVIGNQRYHHRASLEMEDMLRNII